MRPAPLLMLVLVIAGCGADVRSTGAPARAPVLRLGLTPFLDLPVLYRESQALAGYLGKNLGVKARLVLVPEYRAMRHMLVQGRLDVVWCTPGLYASCRGKIPYDVLCATSRGPDSLHRGLIVVRAASPYRTVHDLKDKVFAYVDRSSATGFVLPGLYLEREGLDPLRHFKDVQFAHNHTAALTDLLEGRCDAAAVHDAARTPEGGIDSRFRVLAVTGTSPADPVLVNRNLSMARKDELRRLLLRMPEHAGGPATLDVLRACDGIVGFVSAREEDYRLEETAAH